MLDKAKCHELAEVAAQNIYIIPARLSLLASDSKNSKIIDNLKALQDTKRKWYELMVKLEEQLYDIYNDDRALQALWSDMMDYTDILADGSDNHKIHREILRNTMKNAMK